MVEEIFLILAGEKIGFLGVLGTLKLAFAGLFG